MHFLFSCKTYNVIRAKYKLEHFTAAQELFNDANYSTLGKYLIEAFATRDEFSKTVGRRVVGEVTGS